MNKEIKLHIIAIFNNKEYELEDLINNLLNKLEAYENMRKEAINYINSRTIFGEYTEQQRSFLVNDEVNKLLNILNKGGDKKC